MPTSPKAEVPVLHLPDWLPAAVREEVIKLQAGEFASHIQDEGEDILIHLACDERMKEVWKYLKRRRPVCAQPARFPDPRDPQSLEKIKSKIEASDTSLGQDEGQRQFFRHAFFYAANQVYGRSVMSRSNLNKRKASYAQAAEKLEALAATLRSLGCTNYADQLKKMASDVRESCTNPADQLEETAPDVRRDPDDDVWIVERDRARAGLEKSALGAPEVRRYIAELANFNRIVFGNVLSGIVAIVTNVAFDLREKKTSITREQVREMVRAPRPLGFRIHNKGV